MTVRRASDRQIERPTFAWTPLDESADPPTGADPATEIAQLRYGLARRDTIGMAKGLLMGTTAWTPTRRSRSCAGPASQQSNTKLVKVAAELVDRHSRAPLNGTASKGDESSGRGGVGVSGQTREKIGSK